MDTIKYQELFTFSHKPFDHQSELMELSKDMENYGFLMEMGTGKSKSLVDYAAYLYATKQIDAVLLVAPKGVYMEWIDTQLPTHWPKDLPGMWSYWSSIQPKPLTQEWKALGSFNGCRWAVINTEALSHERPLQWAAAWCRKHNKRLLIAIDESTGIKNMRSKRTKNLFKLAPFANVRRIMTGNTNPQGRPTELFSQTHFLKPGILGYTSLVAFRNRYCIMRRVKLPGGVEFDKFVGTQNLEELSLKLKGFTYRKLKDECLDLPPKIYHKRSVQMSDEQKDVYKQLVKNGYVELCGKMCTTTLAMTLLQKLHQVACGFLKMDDGSIIELDNERYDILDQVIEDMEGKIIIWSNHVFAIREIVARLSKEYGHESVVSYYGETDTDERRANVHKFRNHPEVRFFVGNPATGRFGLTLVESFNVIYFSNSYDLEHRIQSEDRTHRIGTTKPVNYVDLVAYGTCDEKLINALRNKFVISSLVNGDSLRDWI